MSTKRVLFISFIITLVASVTPIQRTLRVGFECPPPNEEACFGEFTTYGFPVVLAKPNIWFSPTHPIDWDDPIVLLTACILFIPNWAIYAFAVKMTSIIRSELQKDKMNKKTASE